MEDIIDIIVTETTNLIEITSQPTDEIIDVNIIDNREDVTLNVTPTVVEININSLTGNFGVNWGDINGTLSNQTDLQAVLNAKADLVDGKVPSSQLPSYVDDVVEVANYAALPVTGEVGKIYITLDTNKIYRWSGSTYIEIADSTAVWGAITGTLSSQTDLQNALNAKVPYTGATGNVNLGEYGATVGYLGFDTTPTSTPTGIGTTYWDSFYRTLSLIDGDGDTTLQIGQEQRVLVHNNTGSTLADGKVVYVIGSTGELPSVALASNTSETTSSVTFGIVTESIAHGANGFITTSGIIHGLNTNAYDEGAAIYLGSTAGTFTQTKPVAPANSVLVGYIIKKSGGNGSIFVKIQNGYELEELHNVLITSKANNDGLFYESSTSLWKNKSIATVLGYTPANGANYLPLTGGTLTGNLLGTNITISNSLIAKGGTFNGGASAGVLTIDGLGSDLLINRSNTSNGASITLLTDAVEKWNIGLRSAGTTDNFFIYNSNLTANALTINSATSASTFASSVTASALYVTGMTAGSGAIYHTGSRLTFANYNTSGTLHFEVNGGIGALTINADKSATFEAGATFTNSIGVGNTLSAWGAIKTIQRGSTSLFEYGSNNSIVSSNFYYDGGASNYYMNNGFASFYQQYNGGHAFYTAPNGTAGNAITFTKVLDIASTGAATFSSSVKVNGNPIATSGILSVVTSTSTLGATADLGLLITNDGTAGKLSQIGFGYSESRSAAVIGGVISNGAGSTTSDLFFATRTSTTGSDAPTERMRITSSGNVGIGTTAPTFSNSGTGLNVQSASGDGAYLKVNYSGGNSAEFRTGFSIAGIGNVSDNPFQFFTNNTERMRITSSGTVLVGTTSTTPVSSNISGISLGNAGQLQASTDGRAMLLNRFTDGTLAEFHRGGTSVGSISVTTVLTTYNTTSDYRLKEDLKPINGLEIVNKIKVYNYKWKSLNERMDGVLAHELQEVLPYAVQGVKDGKQMQSVDYSKIVPVAIKAIQETDSKVVQLEKKIIILETEIQTLKNN